MLWECVLTTLNKLLCEAMSKLITTVICMFISSSCFSLSVSCPVDEEFKKYVSEAKLEYKWDVDTWLVKINAPDKIGKYRFAKIQINKEGEGMAIPLQTENEKGIVSAHFYLNENAMKGMSLWVAYGNHCLQGFHLELKPNVEAL